MGQKVNIGGDRLGSGAKMNVELHNYYRSTHNLSKKFQSSLAPGLLYPAYVNIGLNGDKFDIDIETITRTLPTQGPLFGAFKMQIDTFVAPIRLYHGVLHNNPINIGLKMKDVILPKFNVKTELYSLDIMQKQVNESNLWKYLGLSGLGLAYEGELPIEKYDRGYSTIQRKLNGVPLLAYYDIFKNYYANKQEDNAFVINSESEFIEIKKVYTSVNETGPYTEVTEDSGEWLVTTEDASNLYITIMGENLDPKYIAVNIFADGDDIERWFSLEKLNQEYPYNWEGAEYQITRKEKGLIQIRVRNQTEYTSTIYFANVMNTPRAKEGVYLKTFPLENIDKMRELLLNIKLGEEFSISEKADEELENTLPYTLNSVENPTIGLNKPLVGLVTKTYQSDLFNNWIKSETIDGENGIGAITRIDTTNGLELDTLNLAQKVYNMLNRIAVSGGTYEDWQSAVYSYETIRKAETPMYVGGYSCEIMFDEVISTASTETTEFKQQSLGSIGGRGRQVKEKGGRIKFEVDEPSIIMILVSLTPRITYSQGNKWFLTEIDSIDDLHKPALDGIGYQDLLVEQMAYTGTTINPDGTVREKLSAGKTVAWINYMTDVNECYGDFAAEEGKAYMVLNRNYDIVKENGELQAPTDITTYIDPAKFNYAFTYNELQAQNFWTEIQFNVTARRLMSAKQIPNL